MRLFLLSLTALLLTSLTGCATMADISRAVLESGVVESIVAGTAESVIAANTDLSATETAALAGVAATGVRSFIAKPLELWISRNWGSAAAA